MLIQIERCSLPSGWYKDLISYVIEVDSEDSEKYYKGEWFILKIDCRRISKRKQHEES